MTCDKRQDMVMYYKVIWNEYDWTASVGKG